MLRIIQNSNTAGAKGYYTTADYYSEGQEIVGQWRGKGAAQLGLAGTVSREDWTALCENRDPQTGRALTARTKQERRVGYDFNFHAPKSLSLLYGLAGDERLLAAFRESVGATMHDMEAEMATRVRQRGRDEDRTTGNMTWGEFVHFTARPVDGIPDPHLHAHCFVFNATYDKSEGRWKAGQFAGLKRDAPYFEAVFHARLARKLEELGLPVERTRKGWEVADLDQATLKRFSRRTSQIEKLAAEKGVHDPKAKAELGAKSREKKQAGLSMPELRELWRSWLSPDEAGALGSLHDAIGGERRVEDIARVEQAIDASLLHCFERHSVVSERRFATEAMRRAVGAALPERITAAIGVRDLVRGTRDGVEQLSTKEVLAEEQRMLAFARDGRGVCDTLGEVRLTEENELSGEQRNAVAHVLGSRDHVTLVRGAAGTGKTKMMKEAVAGIEASGRQVFVFAPSAEASRSVLRDQEKFAGADTVARLLVDEKLQDSIRGQAIWIDEAGLLGSRTMAQLFGLAEQKNARVVLSGDRRQHGSVERGAALRLLEEEAGIIPAELRTIRRQKDEYRQAVQALSDGRINAGFKQLDRLKWIREAPDEERYALLAADYVASVKDSKTALVVAPTHLEGRKVTGEIRDALKRSGRLGTREHSVLALKNLNLTEAERADALNYSAGDRLVFHQNAKGFTKGDRVTVGDAALPLDQAARFQLYQSGTLALASGDLIRITRNGSTVDGKHRLNNGTLFTVRDFTPQGNIRLSNGWIIDKDFGHLAHGYCVTSHASQGKTVDRVFVGQSSDSFPASSREQFYVSASRGRESCTIYTSSKRDLLRAVSQSDERLTATELVSEKDRRSSRATMHRMRKNHQPHDDRSPERMHELERDQ